MTSERPVWVYVYRNPDGSARYVGCTADLGERRKAHGRRFDPATMVPVALCSTRERGLEVEAQMIRRLAPLYNHQHNPKWHARSGERWVELTQRVAGTWSVPS